MSVAVLLLAVAAVLGVLAAFGVGGSRVQLGWLAVALIALGILTTGVVVDT